MKFRTEPAFTAVSAAPYGALEADEEGVFTMPADDSHAAAVHASLRALGANIVEVKDAPPAPPAPAPAEPGGETGAETGGETGAETGGRKATAKAAAKA